MSFVHCGFNFAMSFRMKRTYVTPKVNRVDADPKLIQYHETGTGPKPTPEETNFLPLRTRIAVKTWSDMHMAQTHAYYEEIDTIPAASVEQESKFKAGHWYVVHPVPAVEMLDFSARVLQDLQKWIEEDSPNDLFIRKSGQLLDFKKVRIETLENAKRELGKRKGRGEIGKEEGYMGSWEQVDEGGETDRANIEGEGKGKDKAQDLPRHTDAALAEAEQMGRAAAEEAKIKDEYDFM